MSVILVMFEEFVKAYYFDTTSLHCVFFIFHCLDMFNKIDGQDKANCVLWENKHYTKHLYKKYFKIFFL